MLLSTKVLFCPLSSFILFILTFFIVSIGVLVGEAVACPWHSAEFSVTTGESLSGPAFDAIPTFPVRIEGEDIYVTVPLNGLEKLPPAKKGHLCNCQKKRTFVIIGIFFSPFFSFLFLYYCAVGSGGAGFIAAQTLRQDGFRGRVVLVTKEV